MPTTVDPLTVSVIAAGVGTVVTAVLTRTPWSSSTKRAIAIAVAVLLTVIAWYATAYPLSWRLIATQLTVIYGAGQLIYAALKPTGLLTWIEQATEPTSDRPAPRHAAGADQ